MLSESTRWLLRIAALLYLAVGLVFFTFSSQSAAAFPWSVSPFMAMTIGGWCLGNAGVAWEAARIWRFALIFPSLVYLWAFGLLQLIVVAAFAGALQTGNVLTWPYLAALAVTALSGVFGTLDWVRRRPATDAPGAIPRWAKPLTAFFVLVFVGLGLGMTLAQPGGLFARGGFFPEPMTMFTVRAFAAFFLALALGIGSFFLARGFRTMIEFARVSLLLDAPVTAAALANIGAFNFGREPFSAVYLFGYITSFIVIAAIVWRFRERVAPQRA